MTTINSGQIFFLSIKSVGNYSRLFSQFWDTVLGINVGPVGKGKTENVMFKNG